MQLEDDGGSPGGAERSTTEAGGDGRTAVLITGMHRNGTSALARTLSLLGAALPADLVAANEGNPNGHWEPRGMVELNDRMLADASSDLYSVRDIAPSWFGSAPAAAFAEEAARLVADAFPDGRLVVLKDPRTALLAPVWNRALAQNGFRVVHVLPLRHPAEVAESLRRRHLKTIPYDAWAKPRGEAVWLRYTLAAVRGSRGYPRAFLSYADLLADWRGAVERLGAEIGVRWPGLGTDAEAEVDAFLHGNERASGRHASAAADSRMDGLDLADLAAACHDALMASRHDPARVEAVAVAFEAAFAGRIGGAGDLVTAFEDLYGLVWRFYEEGGALRQSLELSVAAEGRLREASQRSWAALTAANNDKLRLQLDAGSRDRHVASLGGEVARLGALVAGLETENAKLAASAATVPIPVVAPAVPTVASLPAEADARERLVRQLRAAEARLVEHRDAADSARRSHERALEQLAAVHRSTSWRVTAPLRALSRVARGRT